MPRQSVKPESGTQSPSGPPSQHAIYVAGQTDLARILLQRDSWNPKPLFDERILSTTLDLERKQALAFGP
jgi:hypothetical protein